MIQFTLNLETIPLSDEEFFKLCQNNPDLRFERNANGELVIRSPTGGETSHRNAGLTTQLWIRNQQYKLEKKAIALSSLLHSQFRLFSYDLRELG